MKNPGGNSVGVFRWEYGYYFFLFKLDLLGS